MSGVSFPVTRPGGRVLVIGSTAHRAEPIRVLTLQGYDCGEANDPYVAMLDLCRQRLAYHGIVLSLASIYHEELMLIATIKRRLPHIEIWLTQTEGRMTSLAEGIRLGADGWLAEDGTLERVAATTSSAMPHPTAGGTEISGDHSSPTDGVIATGSLNGSAAFEPESASNNGSSDPDDLMSIEPVLSAEELRALLQDQPVMPPTVANDER